MMLGDIYTLWLREMLRFVRARSRIITSLAMPFFWLVFIGVGFGSSFKLPGIDYIDFLAPGIVAMVMLFTSIFSGISIIWDRQFGFLKEILVAPVSRTSIVLGKTVGGATVALLSGLIMFVIAALLGVIKLTTGIIALPIAIVFMFLTAVVFVSMGLTIASRMKSMEGFQMIMSFIVMPIFFLSGALFPIQNTPQWMQIASRFDPLSYGVDGLRVAFVNTGVLPLWLDLIGLAFFSTAFVVIGAYMFKKSTSL